MGSLFTRGTAHRHSYAALPQPSWVTSHALSASLPAPPHSQMGPQIMPLASGVTSYAADGAPFYNSGYLPGYPSRPLAGDPFRLHLPPVAAQIDLTDTTSWDRPVTFCGVR